MIGLTRIVQLRILKPFCDLLSKLSISAVTYDRIPAFGGCLHFEFTPRLGVVGIPGVKIRSLCGTDG